ncbi:glycerophosphodiester phosphodiesterase [bacterium SCSIO 12741]|nr:glycerophosphodiester phosphodiesterase [bacterium SCSIO 12741]
MVFRYSLILSLFIFGACTSVPPAQEELALPHVLGHRGSGSGCRVMGQDSICENSYPAVIMGLDHYQGVEVDIQMSADGTLWMYHDALMIDQDSNQLCIPQSGDFEIRQMASRVRAYKYLAPLDTIFDYHRKYGLLQSISLDVKGYFSEACFPGQNADQKYLLGLADSLVQLIHRYEMTPFVMVETDYQDVLDRIRSRSDSIPCYLLAYGHWEKAKQIIQEKGYQGLSYSFSDPELTPEKVEAVRKAGWKVQIWTPNGREALYQAWSLQPDYIQTDDSKAVRWIQQWNDSLYSLRTPKTPS